MEDPAVDSLDSSLETTDQTYQVQSEGRFTPPAKGAGGGFSLFGRFNKSAFMVAGASISAIALLAGAGLLFSLKTDKNPNGNNNLGSSYAVTSIPLKGVNNDDLLQINQANTLLINGDLTVKNSLTIVPSTQPVKPNKGQLYYDAKQNELFFFNGAKFIPVGDQAPNAVTSLAGASGDLTLGNGLQIVDGQLSLTDAVLQGTTAVASVGSTVSSVQGQSGDVVFSAGAGVSINGTNFTNTGVLSVGGATGDVAVGRGLIMQGGSLASTISIAAGSANLIIADDGNGNFTITDNGSGSSQITLGPPVAQSDATGNTSININKTISSGGFLQFADNGTTAFAVDRSGVITTGTIAYSQVLGAPATTVTSIGGVSGAISVGAGLTMSGNTLSNTGIITVTGTANQVVANTVGTGVTLSLPQDINTTSSPVFNNLNVQGGNLVSGIAGSQTGFVSLANNANANLVKLQGLAPSGSGNATIQFPSVAGGGSDIVCLLALGNCAGAGGGVTTSGSSTGYVPVYNGAQTITNSVIYQTGTSVGVNTTTPGAYVFNVQGGDVNFSGNATIGNGVNVTGISSFAGNTSITGSNTFTVGTGATSLGGTLGVTGATTLGSTLGVTGVSTFNGNVSVTGANTLTVGTGATTLGGALSVSGNATLNGNVTQSGSGTFSTGTGTVSLNGDTTVASGKNFTQSGAGTFTTGSGAVSLNGDTTIAGTKTLTVGTGATTLGGTLTVAGLTTLNSGVTISGTTAINTTGSATTTIGNSGAALSLASTGFNVTTAGAVTGVTTLAASGAISGATSGNTINGLVVNSGALSSVTSVATSGGYTQTGAGANTLSGATTFSAAGTALTVNNNATVTGTLTSGTLSVGAGGISDSGTLTVSGVGGSSIAGQLSLTAAGVALNVTNNATIGGSLAIQGANGLTLGTAGSVNGKLTFANSTNTDLANLAIGAPIGGGNTTYNLPSITGNTSDTICLFALGNCGSSPSTVTTSASGTTNAIPKFTSANTIADSNISDDGTTVTVSAILSAATITGQTIQSTGAMSIIPGGNLSIGATNHTTSIQGNSGSTFTLNASGFTSTLGFINPTANRTINVPNESGTICLQSSTNCGFALAGSGVTSLNSLTGGLTLANSTGLGSTVTINNAAADGTTKGIATFNSTNFQAASGVVNTIQDIALTSAVQFGSLTLGTGDLTLSNSGVIYANNLTGTDSADVTFDAVNHAFVFTTDGGTNSFMFPTYGGLGQVICTSGITCASGGGTALILEPTAVQDVNQNRTAIFVNKSAGTGNLLQLQAGGTDAAVIDASGITTITSLVAGTLTTNTITSTGALTIGNTAQSYTLQGTSSSTISSTDGTYSTSVGFNTGSGGSAPTGNVNYQFQNDSSVAPGTYNVCTTAGNCAGVGGSVTTTGGTAGKIAKFTAGSNIADSIISESGSTISIGGSLSVGVSGSAAITLGVASTTSGTLVFNNASNSFTATFTPPTTATGNTTIQLPNQSGTLAVAASGPIALDAVTGQISCPTCLTSGGGAGGGVTNITGTTTGSTAINGTLTINNALTSSSTITIDNASTTQKGIAQFNSTNFSVASGTVNTIQDIATNSAVTFGDLTLQGTVGLTLGSSSNVGQVSFKDGTADGFNANYSIATLTANRSVVVPNASGTIAVSGSGNINLSALGDITTINNPSFTTSVTSPIFQGSGALSVKANGGTLSVGTSLRPTVIAGDATSTFAATSGANTTTVGFTAPTANRSILFPNESGTICLQTSTNCGFAAAANVVNSVDGLQGTLTIANSSGSGAVITINNASTTQKGIAQFNATNFSDNGAGTINTIQDIDTSAAPSFAGATLGASGLTVNGASTLNGNLSITGTNTLSVGTGLASFGGGLSVTAGLTTLSGGATITGTVGINTTGTANTAIGNNTGTFSLASSGLKVTTGGALSGITTLALSGAITGATSGNTINGLVINSGALSAVTDYAQASGNFAISGTGTFDTGTGAVSLNGNTSVTGSNMLTVGTGLTTLGGGLTVTGNGSVSGVLSVGSSSQFQVSATGDVTTSGTFNGQTLGNSSIFTGSVAVQGGGLTVGVAGTTAGSITFANTSSTRNLILQGLNPTGAGDATLQIPSFPGGSTDSVCLLTLGNCVGTSGGVSTSGGTQNYITKYSNAGATQISNSQLFDNGSFVGLNTTTNNGQLSVLASGSQGGFFLQGAATGSAAVQTIKSGGSTGDLLQLQNSSGSVLTKVDASGNLTTGMITSNVGGSQGTVVGSGQLNLQADQFSATAGKIIINATTAGVVIGSVSNASVIGLTVKGVASQSADLLQVQNSSSTVLSGVDASGNIYLNSGQSIKLNGSTSFPSSPTEGQIYFRTDTKQLYVYANGKWQADRSTATKIVADGSTSQNPESADFVVPAASTSAQTTINAAIAALPAGGGSIYVEEGTYVIDGTITIPANVTITGADSSTIIKLKNGINADINAISTVADNVAVKHLKLDGNKTNNSAGIQRGVYSSSGFTIKQTYDSLIIQNFRSDGLYLSGTTGTQIMNSASNSNGGDGFNLACGSSCTSVQVSNNIASSNTGSGFTVAATNSAISGNVVLNNTSSGIQINYIGNNVSNNTVTGNGSYGIYIGGGSNTVSNNESRSNASSGIYMATAYAGAAYGQVVSGNHVVDNGGAGVAAAIQAVNGDGCSIINNVITDAAGTGVAISISPTLNNLYLSGNTFSGVGANGISDSSSSTIYSNQINTNGNLVIRGGAGVGINTTAPTASLQNTGALVQGGLATPAAPTVTNQGTAGGTSYTYAVTATDGLGETIASTGTTTATGNATLNGTNFNRIIPARVNGAVSYKIYRTASGGTPASTGLIGTLAGGAATFQFDDTGIAASGSAPTVNTTGGARIQSNGTVSLQTSAGSQLLTVDGSLQRVAVNQLATPGTITPTLLSPPASPSATPAGTTGATTYTYRISAFLSSGFTTAVSANATTATGNAILTGTNKINLSWTSVAGAAGYNIYRIAAGGTSPTTLGLIGTTTATTFSDTGLTISGTAPNASTLSNGTTYYYKVTALDGSGGESAPSAEASQAVSAVNQAVILNWVGVPGARSYRIYRGTSTGNENTYFTSTTNNYADYGPSGTAGSVPSSSSVAFASNLANGNSAQLTIGSVGTATGQLYLGGSLIGLVTIAQQGTAGATQWQYQVAGVTANGAIMPVAQSLAGSTITGNATLDGTNYNQLSWQAIPGAVSYNVYRIYFGSGTPGTTGLIGNTTTTAFNDTGVAASGSILGTTAIYSTNISLSSPNHANVAAQPQFSGNYLYNFPSSDYLQIFDASNPLRPSLANLNTSIASSNTAFTIAGRYMYTIYGCSPGSSTMFNIYDISNSLNPSLTSSTAVVGQNITAGRLCTVTVSGKYAYLVNGATGNLFIYDVSNPASPVARGVIPSLNSPSNVIVQGRYIYIPIAGNITKIYDIANPDSPTLTGSLSTVGGASALSGRYLFSVQNNILYVIDVSNPAVPVIVSTTSLTINGPALSSLLTVNGHYLYIPNSGNYAFGTNIAFQVYDISNPTSPVLLGSQVGASGNNGAPVIKGRYAYVGTGGNSAPNSNLLQVYDLGGEYAQNLEAGNAQINSLAVDGAANIGGNLSVNSGLQVTGATQLNGDLGVSGTSFFQGAAQFAGGIQGGASISGISAPAAPTIATNGTAGSTSYSYTVAAVSASGGTTLASTAGTTATGNATLDGTNFNTISWSAVSGAVSYKVYRTVSGGTPSTTGLIGSTNSTSLNDTGLAGSGTSATADTSGRLTIGTVTTSNASTQVAQTLISTGGASAIGQVIQGASGQTADLIQFQNSAGTVLNRIDANGSSYYGNVAAPVATSAVGSITGGTLAAGTYYYKVSGLDTQGNESLASNEVSATVASGSTGSVVINWNQTSGAVSYRVYRGTSAGAENVYYSAGSLLTTFTFTDTGAANTGGLVATTGTASLGVQSAANGRLVLAANAGAGGTFGGGVVNITNTTSTAGAVGLRINVNAGVYALSVSGTGILAVDAPGTAAGRFAVLDNGNIGIQNASAPNRVSVNALTTADAAAQVAISTNGTGNKGLIIQGVASQSADLFQIQRSDGYAFLRVFMGGGVGTVSVDGTVTGNSLIASGAVSSNSLGQLTVYPASAATIGQVTRAFAGQTADLQQFQTSTGTVLSGFDANGNIYTAAGQSIKIAGSGTRPSSPTAGQIYYDTTTNQLIQYNGSKWVSDRSTTTKVVAASNSSQAQKDAADYVATGTGDQATINTALTAAAGGSVYLMEGTYSVTAAISIPNNTTLSGAGAGTLITIPNAQNGTYNIITNTDTSTGTHVSIHDLQIDGNKANQTSGVMTGILMSGMGGGTGSSARDGAKITNIIVRNTFGVSSKGIVLSGSVNNTISGSTILGNANGLSLTGSANLNVITGNTVQGNSNGISVNSSLNNTFSGNAVQGNVAGIFFQSSDNNTISSNTFSGNTSQGVYLSGSSSNVVSSNKIHDTGGATDNNGIYLAAATNNTITSNDITDTSCTTTCYGINISDSSSTGNLLSANRLTSPETINDAASNTIYNAQTNGNGDIILKTTSGKVGINTLTPAEALNVYNGNLQVDYGNIKLNQVTAPGAPTVAVNATAGNLTGPLYYVVTFVTANGETEYGTQSASINPTAQQVNLTAIPIGTNGVVTARKIYRGTTSGGPFKLVTTIADNTTTSYTDNIAAGSLTTTATNMNTTGGLYVVNGNNMLNISANSNVRNSFVGLNSGSANTNGIDNTALGYRTLFSNTTGNANTALGSIALQSNTTGVNNVAVGYNTLQANTTGGSNTGIGAQALLANTTGTNNTAIGFSALFANTTGTQNTAIGQASLSSNITGSFNTVAGYLSAAGNNCSIGAGCNINGVTASGFQAGYSLQTGSDYSTLFGYQAGYSNTTGGYNTNIGYQAGYLNQTGSGNVFIGKQAGYNETGSNQLYIANSNTTTPLIGGDFSAGTATINGAATVKSLSGNSTTAFQVQNNAGSNLLTADTSNMRLAVNATYAAMTTPTGLAAGVATAGGSLAATTTYYYKVTAIDSAGGETAATTEVSRATTAPNKTIPLTWNPVTGASGYKVYRSTTTGTEVYLTTVLSNSYTDAGTLTAGSASAPTTTTAYVSTNVTNGNLQLTVGGNGTPTGQVYVSGTVATTPVSAITVGTGGIMASGPHGIYALGNYVYLTSFASKVYVVDVTNPNAPVVVTSASLGGVPTLIAGAGKYLYVGFNNSLVVLDVSNPAAPVDKTSGGISLGSNPTAFYAQGKYLYVGTGSGRLFVYDVSNPAKPLDITGNGIVAAGTPNAITVVGGYAYVTAGNKLQVFNVSNPAAPTDVSSGGVSTGNNAFDIFVSGRYAYVSVAQTLERLDVFDISNPATPVLVGQNSNGSYFLEQVVVQGRYAYVADFTNGIQFFDVSNPTQPINIGSTGSPGGANLRSLSVAGRYAYATGSGNQLYIYDLGGEYAQQFEAGGAAIGTLSVSSNATFAGDASVQGGISVGQSIQAAGDLGVGGNGFVQGTLGIAGGIQGGVTINGLSTPSAPTITTSGTAGSTSYSYAVVAVSASGGTTPASSAGTIATGNATLTSSNYNVISWTPVSGAVSYKVYRTATAGTPATTGLIGTTSAAVLNDTGLAGDSSTASAINTSGQFTLNGPATFNENNLNGVSVVSDLSSGARSGYLMTLSQANNASNNNSSGLLSLSNSDTGSTAALLNIGQVSGGTGISITAPGTNAVGVNVFGVGGGTAFKTTGSLSNGGAGLRVDFNGVDPTGGSAIDISGTSIGTLSSYGGNLVNIAVTRQNTATSGTLLDSGNFLNVARSNTQNGLGGAYSITGALASLSSNCTQTAGTCTDTSNILNLNQQYANASGDALKVQNSGTGAGINVTQTGGTAITVGTTTGVGLGFTNAITTGIGVQVASDITSGVGVGVIGGSSGVLSAFTGNLILANPSRNNNATSGTLTDTGNFLNLARSNTQSGAGGTFAITGAVATFSSNCTQTAGTCTDTSNVLKLNQQYASASGAVLNVQNSGTGAGINLAQTSGTSIVLNNASGTGINFANLMTAGTGISMHARTSATAILIADVARLETGSAINITDNAGSSSLVGYTGKLVNVDVTRTNTATSGTITDSGNFLNLNRSIVQNGAGGTFAVSGALATLSSNCTQTAGTCTDTSNVLSLNQQYASSTGAVLSVQGSGTGTLASFTSNNAAAKGVVIQGAASQTGDLLRLQDNTAANLFSVSSAGAITVAGSGSAPANAPANQGRIFFNTGNSMFQLSGNTGAYYDICTTSGNCTGSGGGASTLQTAYGASTGGTTPEIKLNTTQGALDFQDADTTLGGNLLNVRGSNAGGLGSIIFGVNSSTGVAINATSTTALQIQNAGATALLFSADTTNKLIKIGTGTPTVTSAATGGLYVTDSVELASGGLLRVGTTTDGFSYNDGVSGKLRLRGTARNDITIKLAPEFNGAVLRGDGTNNTGTMAADFCSGSSSRNINAGACGASDEYSYYEWTTTQGSAQDYDLYVNYNLPSNLDSMSSINIAGFRSTGSDSVVVSIYDSNDTTTPCVSGVAVATSNGAWTNTSLTLTGCTFTADTQILIKVTTTATNTNFARIGPITFAYKGSF